MGSHPRTFAPRTFALLYGAFGVVVMCLSVVAAPVESCTGGAAAAHQVPVFRRAPGTKQRLTGA